MHIEEKCALDQHFSVAGVIDKVLQGLEDGVVEITAAQVDRDICFVLIVSATHASEQSYEHTWLARKGCDRLFGEPCRDGDRVQVEIEAADARGLSLEEVDHRIEVSENGFGKMLRLGNDSIAGGVRLRSTSTLTGCHRLTLPSLWRN